MMERENPASERRILHERIIVYLAYSGRRDSGIFVENGPLFSDREDQQSAETGTAAQAQIRLRGSREDQNETQGADEYARRCRAGRLRYDEHTLYEIGRAHV